MAVADYTRKGFVDGRAVRIPTVSVRPVRPCGCFELPSRRDPRAAQRHRLRLPGSEKTLMWMCSPRKVVGNLIRAFELRPKRGGRSARSTCRASRQRDPDDRLAEKARRRQGGGRASASRSIRASTLSCRPGRRAWPRRVPAKWDLPPTPAWTRSSPSTSPTRK